ncbi:MAG: MCE family protein [Kiritimatiellae bacterium]|nr:MCE family protein [Kiritimatiellia bacterium]
MNENKANYAKIGFFILFGALLILLVVAIVCARMLNRDVVKAETYFKESVAGLDVGSAVKFRGVPVGSVSEVGFVYSRYPWKEGGAAAKGRRDKGENRKQILVVMSLDPKKFGLLSTANPDALLHDFIDHGLRVKLTSSGVTGLSYLELDYFENGHQESLPPDGDWTPQYTFIPAISSTMTTIRRTVDEVFAKLNSIDFHALGGKVNAVLTLATNRLDGLDTGAVVHEATNLLAEIRKTNASLNGILADPRWQGLAGQASNTLEQADATIASVRVNLDTLSVDLQKLLAGAEGVVSTNTQGVAEIVAAVRRASQGFDQTVQAGGPALGELLQNLREASAGLNQLIRELSANPSSLLFGQPPARLEENDNR